MKINFRSGSALLIVLGMLSFMVVSAIGFSVFMRQNRLPSSFVRRNTTAHQLLNAALARAMNELDSAIGDDPFPGVDSGDEHATRLLKGYSNQYIDDTWKGRVFVGKTRSRYESNVNTNSDHVLVAHDDTVATLTMEGLAYLPPCLVNEARYFSRHTPTAAWHMLAYDAGRYAYTAINVSDYFDINNIPFADARTYSPSNRVSLAYLFGSDPREADRFRREIVEGYGPFVSLADFNLVMYNQIGNARAQERYGFVSPFGDYASGNGRFDHYFGNANTNYIAKTTFVTESYFPEEEVSDDLLDLNEDDCQPFDAFGRKNIQQVYSNAKSRLFFKAFQKEYKIDLSAPTLANLYDYLDEDSLPVSLAVPSVEQVPVIAGYEVRGLNGIKVKLIRAVLNEGDTDPSSLPSVEAGWSVTVPVKYMLQFEGLNNLQIDVTTLFPFAQAKPSGFEISAAAHIFWGPVGADTTADGVCQAMNMQGGAPQKSEDDLVVHGLFTEKNKEEDGGFDEFNRFTFKPDTKSISGGYAQQPEDALKVTSLSLSTQNKSGTIPFAVVNEKWVAQKVGEKSYKPQHESSSLDAGNGAIKGLFDKNHNPSAILNASYKPYLAVRFMIKNSDGVVDLAPACGWDDVHNFGSVSSSVSPYLDMNRAAFIIPTTDAEIKYSAEELQGYINGISFANTEKKQDLSFSISSSSRVCKDPKWNHNVYNWSVVNDSIKDDIIGAFRGAGKDSDFFQNSSDSEWLQSIAELAMLPRTMDFSKSSKLLTGSMVKGASDANANFAKSLPLTKGIATARGENVYLCSSYDGDEDAADSLFTDGVGGFRINPYSDDPNIFLAALAYTPYNWGAASPDNNWKFTEAVKHTFSESADAPSAQISMDDLKEIASSIHESFASSDDWVEAYNDLGWGFANETDIFNDYGLTSADKKFLYGFWKGCFANRQQLFIIFLRAEPSVGSGTAGSGQGGRAVAVVWRDPKEPKKTGTNNNNNKFSGLDSSTPPHKMRVLFYKALE